MPQLGQLLSSPDAVLRRVAKNMTDKLGASASAQAVAVYVPGRVEFLGKHTDYAGGRSLLLAVDRGFRLVAVARKDKELRIASGPAGTDVMEFEFGQTPAHAKGHWVNYSATVARRVNLNFAASLDLKGADIAFISDVPIAAGMSSSSALMVATFLGISGVNHLDRTELYREHITDRIRLAEYLGCVENGQSYGKLTGEKGVGTFGGSEDHTAMLNCKAGYLSQFSYAPSVFERDIPWPAGVSIIIASSGVEAVKTAAAMEQYNRASLRSRMACEAYNRSAGTQFKRMRDIAVTVGADGLAQALAAITRGAELGKEQDFDLPGRFEQFFREDQEIIPAVGDALVRGDVQAIGPLIDASHAGAVKGLVNQIPQTNFLQASARKLGAIAASAFGAGFGGSVWAMTPTDKADGFRKAWHDEYAKSFAAEAKHAEFFITAPGDSATIAE